MFLSDFLPDAKGRSKKAAILCSRVKENEVVLVTLLDRDSLEC